MHTSNASTDSRQEIHDSLEKLRTNIQVITKNIDSLKDNMHRTEKNVSMLEQELTIKMSARDEVSKDLARAEKSWNETKRSEEEFQKGLNRDLEQFENTKNNITVTKRRLAQLQENLVILQENIEIDRENMDKVSRARELWEKNLRNYQQAASDLDTLQKELSNQVKSHRENIDHTNDELRRWTKQLDDEKHNLERLEQELKRSKS